MPLLILQESRFGKGLVVLFALAVVLCAGASCGWAQDVQVAEVDADEPKQEGGVRVVTILTEDEQGQPLRFPINVAADDEAGETYVINGGLSNIVVYGQDYFPYLVLGAGRGIDSPQCVFFGRTEGRIYIGQNSTEDKPSRLTVLNAAFLPDKEITFAGMPGAEDFSAINGVVGVKGKIYLVGEQVRGVLVLTADGAFSHWLKPLDKIHISPVTTEDNSEKRRAYLFKMRDGELEPEAEPEPVVVEEESVRPAGLPESLLPKARNTLPRDATKGQDLHPVIVKDIAIDHDGRIFLLSEEMSKVYVYGPGENLILSFGEKGGSPGKMSRPRGLGLDENKQCVYIVDYMRQTVLVFDMAGRFIFEFGGRGAGPMWFNFPNALTVDRNGNVIIADLFNNRVQVLESEFTMDYPVFGNTKGLAGKGGVVRDAK